MRTVVTRRYHFQSVHSLNTGVHREIEHGHSFAVEVSFYGVAASAVDAVMEGEVLAHVHARNLNSVLEPATGEVLVDWIHERLLASNKVSAHILAVCLQETRKNRFVSARSGVEFV